MLGPSSFHSPWIHTMQRCAAALFIAASLFTAGAQAQVARLFPPNTLRGELVVEQPPEVRLNGKPARLAPGARVRSPTNMFVLTGALVGQKLVVHYTTDPMGMLRDVWVLNEAELAKKLWPRSEKELQTWVFDPATHTWAKP
jgi:hypothetical protein